ncbi:MAG TPA: agmatine deiminase family protein [Gemmataceae bacterium]|nr:agmatine deiminase family protein [Gemmataceae bacterium]
MIPDWQTDLVFFSDLLQARHPDLLQGLVRILDEAGVGHRLLGGTRDIWARDYMPVQAAKGDFVLFRYEPSYLDDDEESVTPEEARRAVPTGTKLRPSGINLDGGNVVASSTRAILTAQVYWENPEYDRPALRQELAHVLQAECILVCGDPDDVFGHADGVVRFLDEGRVVVNDYREEHLDYGEGLEAALSRHGLAVERLPYAPTDEEHDGIPSAVGCYLNFLRVGQLVVMPAFGLPQDDLACRTLERLLPGAGVVPLRCEGLASKGGVLNCVSWTVKAGK